jgi:hypothetical protein
VPTPDPADTYARPQRPRCGCDDCEADYQESRVELWDAVVSLVFLAVVTALAAALALPHYGWTPFTVAAAVIAVLGVLANLRNAVCAWTDLRTFPRNHPALDPGEDQPS